MNTLAALYRSETRYLLPHADFLRLQHAHNVGVMLLDLLDAQACLGQAPTPVQHDSLASAVALLTDQLGHVVTTCESLMTARMEAPRA